MLWPNGTTAEPRRSDGYGPRPVYHTSAGSTRPYHVGTDHYGIGTIRSVGDGTVVESGWIDWAGWQVLLYLGEIDKVRTWVRFCHFASASSLRRGDTVKAGDPLGQEGATGQVLGVHLHWEVYRGRVDRGWGANPGTTIDPRQFVLEHLGEDDMGTLDNTEENYAVFASWLHRSGFYDDRENGNGPDWRKGRTKWEVWAGIRKAIEDLTKLVKEKPTVTPEQVKQIAEQVVKAIGQPTVTLDYASIAKAVNDDAAKRMQG